jgi:hypothetical protein
MRILLPVAAVLMAVLLSGCGLMDVMLAKTAAVAEGDPKTKPLFSLEGRHVVILVDVANQELLDRYPTVRYRLASAVAQELGRTRAVATIVNPRDLMTYAQTEPEYDRLSAVEIGRHFQADTVLHLVVTGYDVEQATGVETFSGQAEADLRVIDVPKSEQIFPGLGRFHTLGVKSKTGIRAESAPQAEAKILDALALKVSIVFVEYKVEDLPRRPDVN